MDPNSNTPTSDNTPNSNVPDSVSTPATEAPMSETENTAGITTEGTSIAPEPLPVTPQVTAQPTGEDPGKILSILGIVLGVIATPIVGVILSILGQKKSKEAGFDGHLGKIGIIINAVLFGLGTLIVIGFVILLSAGAIAGFTA